MSLARLLVAVTAAAFPVSVAACVFSPSVLMPDPSDGQGGGGGSGSGSSGSSSSASSSGAGESCFNCGDPSCGGKVACEQLPLEWQVVFVKDADPSKPAGTCADGSMGTLYFTGPAGLPDCSPCACSVGAAARCGAPEISCWYDTSDCSGKENIRQQSTTDNECVNLIGVSTTSSHFDGSCRLSNSANVLNPGTCSFQGGAITTPSPWSGAKLVCSTGAGDEGCAAGQRCVPTGPSPDGSACVIRPGSEACPPSFPKPLDVFLNGTDNRSCGLCSCTLGCAGGSYRVQDPNDCMADPEDVTINSPACTVAHNLFDGGAASIRATVAQPAIATCSGGAPQGKVEATGPQRICCK